MADDSVVDSIAAATDSSLPSFDDATTSANLSITESMVSFLRMEAKHAEDRAKRLRKQAALIAEQFGITEESQQSYDLDPNELPPLDEKGLPKYKGKKRGRKSKEKKRKTNPDRPKRKHTGYTLFMQEKYPPARSQHPNLPNKEIISLVARKWKDLGVAERITWKQRAQQSSEGGEITIRIGKESNDDRIDTPASGAGSISNSHLEGNGEENDEDVDDDLEED